MNSEPSMILYFSKIYRSKSISRLDPFSNQKCSIQASIYFSPYDTTFSNSIFDWIWNQSHILCITQIQRQGDIFKLEIIFLFKYFSYPMCTSSSTNVNSHSILASLITNGLKICSNFRPSQPIYISIWVYKQFEIMVKTRTEDQIAIINKLIYCPHIKLFIPLLKITFLHLQCF